MICDLHGLLHTTANEYSRNLPHLCNPELSRIFCEHCLQVKLYAVFSFLLAGLPTSLVSARSFYASCHSRSFAIGTTFPAVVAANSVELTKQTAWHPAPLCHTHHMRLPPHQERSFSNAFSSVAERDGGRAAVSLRLSMRASPPVLYLWRARAFRKGCAAELAPTAQ